jgi:hypothetical protein
MSVISHARRLRVERSKPPLLARVHARLREGALDRRLVAGERAVGDRALAARAWQLTRRGSRMRLANALDAVLAELDGPQRRLLFSSAVPIRRGEAELARSELIRLAERLRDERPVAAQGIALVRRLLCDGSGPLYVPGAEDELWRDVRRAAVALD